MAEPIHDIIECSIKTGKVPQEWKRADVMTIYKNENKEEPFNYRPVPLISLICKICEKGHQETMDCINRKRKNNKIDNLDSEQEYPGISSVTNL